MDDDTLTPVPCALLTGARADASSLEATTATVEGGPCIRWFLEHSDIRCPPPARLQWQSFSMPRRSPRCPDCSSAEAQPIVYGEPDAKLPRRAERREVVLGGCCVGSDDPAWDCPNCGKRFGERTKPYKALSARSRAEWLELIKTMLPAPVRTIDGDELQGGDPIVVMVRLESDAIRIMEPTIEWQGPHSPKLKGLPFGKVSFRASAARVAELIGLAWGKRVSRYRWCPRCRERAQPEHMLSGVCHGCASRVLGVVF
jgi:hypothetical protein